MAAAATARGVRLWKRELQKLANELGLDIVVSHLPPGTSKWNKIEHRLFSVSYRGDCRADLGHHHQNRPHRAL